jgi:hypothetical protein
MIKFRHYGPTLFSNPGFGFYLTFPSNQAWCFDLYWGKHVFVWWNDSSRLARRIQRK